MKTINTLSPSTHPYSVSTTVPLNKARARKPKTPEWSRAEPFDKLAEAYVWIHKEGGKVFTLRLGDDVRERLVTAEDPGRALSKRILRELKRRDLPVPFFGFSLEVTPDDRNELHLHGAILPGNLPLKALKDALRAAGGRIKGRAGSRQVQIKNFDLKRGGPVGWANYPKKGATRTRRVIQHHRLTYICSGLRKLCQVQWDQRRGKETG
jgi:hypothetical protein